MQVIPITHKTSKEDRKKYAELFADEIAYCKNDPTSIAFCRELVSIGALPLLEEICEMYSAPVSSILNDRKKLFRLLNARYVTDVISTIIMRLGMINDRVLLDAPYYKEGVPMDKYVGLTLADLTGFYLWLTLNGADGATVRKIVDQKSQKAIKVREKAYAHCFETLIVRADMAIKALSTHLFLPACKDHLNGKCSKNINSLADALKGCDHG